MGTSILCRSHACIKWWCQYTGWKHRPCPSCNWLFYASIPHCQWTFLEILALKAWDWFPVYVEIVTKTIWLCAFTLTVFKHLFQRCIFPSFLHFITGLSACWSELEYEQKEAKTVAVLLHTGIQPGPRLSKIYSISAWYLLRIGHMTRRNTQGKHMNVTFSKYTKCTKHSEENPNKMQTVKTICILMQILSPMLM